MDAEEIRSALRQGTDALGGIIGRQPSCSADPGWRSTEPALIEKTGFPFVYNSDCRGRSIFMPVVDGRRLEQPQVPVTLPTYDEVIGRSGITAEGYNDRILSLLDPDGLNVLAIHAEVEGIVCREMFRNFLAGASAQGVEFVPLGALLEGQSDVPSGSIERANVPGREGWIARQAAPAAR
jgi:undecaprenyl phosphate-alpha-L-ara4FN deformylase